MESFKNWIAISEESIGAELSLDDAIHAFIEPKNDYELTPATLIDANLCSGNKPFIYLGSTDKVYIGQNGEYHREIIEREKTTDLALASDLQRAYETSYGGQSILAPVSAVGRIGYRINYEKLRKILPLANIKRFLGKEEEVSDAQVAMHIFMPASLPHKNLFREIDIIAIYSGVKTPISVAARAVKLLMENPESSPRSINNTIVVYDKKARLGKEFITHASVISSEPERRLPSLQQELITAQKQSREKSRRFIPKPETMRQAAYQAGIPYGDWTNYANMFRGNNYHG